MSDGSGGSMCDADMHYSENTYRLMIKRAKAAQRNFIRMTSEVGNNTDVYLRLDIDTSLECAVRLAQINADEGIVGTFFVLIDSSFYNPLCQYERELIRQILSCKQDVGIHLTYNPDVKGNERSEYIRRSYSLFRDYINRDVSPILAWHNPPNDIMGGEKYFEGTDLINAYSKPYTLDIEYLSDSNFRNQPSVFMNHLEIHPAQPIQITLHPEVWGIGKEKLEDMLGSVILHRLRRLNRELCVNAMWHEKIGKDLESVLDDYLFHSSK